MFFFFTWQVRIELYFFSDQSIVWLALYMSTLTLSLEDFESPRVSRYRFARPVLAPAVTPSRSLPGGVMVFKGQSS